MKSRIILILNAAALSLACGSNDNASLAGSTSQQPLFATSTVVMSDEGDQTYVSLLPSLAAQSVDLEQSREFAGWAGLMSNDGKLFVSDGEAPTMLRFAIDDEHAYADEGKLSFQPQGATFADSAFVGPDKAYVFADDGVVWDPQAMEIVGGFALPEVENRAGGLEYSGLKTGRSLVVRGNRAYVATNWANWAEYTVSEDSLIVVIDTDKNEVVDQIPVDCPYVDVASLDDDGTIYFSNWVYSLGQTLLAGKRQACAVRMLPGEDRIDRNWSLTFADVTGGREAAALRALGNGKALISVFHDELLGDELDPESLADTASWRFWELDLETLAAQPIDGLDVNAGGFNTSRIDGRNFVLVPGDQYASTSVYELLNDGTAEQRWESPGWSTGLLKLR